MTPDINDDFDTDIDGGDIGGPGGGIKPPERASLKDTWDSNPLLKIAAVVLGISILVGGYLTFAGEKTDEKNRSVISIGDLSRTKVTPGAKETDEEYTKAVVEQNNKTAEEALTTGQSAMPTPVSTAKTGGIDLPDAPIKGQDDPLKEWRARTEAAANKLPQQDVLPQEDAAPAPDVVPMVQPVRPQAAMKVDPQMAKALSTQMRTILAAQAPPPSKKTDITKEPSAYTELKKEQAEAQKCEEEAAKNGIVADCSAQGRLLSGNMTANGAKTNALTTPQKAAPKVIVPAATISYVELLTSLNSDLPGPALAQILSGPFAGGRALGEFELEDEYLVITFKRIIKDSVSYSINGIALDEATTLNGLQGGVDHHYFMRVILPAAAKFVEGYGSAVAETGTQSTVTAGGGIVQDQPAPDAKEQVYKGVEEASKKISDILEDGEKKPVTVTVPKGTTMGLLFMDSVTTASAGK